MYKRIICLLFLISSFSITNAQDIRGYEYWLDSEYANKVSAALNDSVVSLAIPLDNLKTGLHFFNFRAVDTHGEVGNLTRKLFYMPETEVSAGILGYECWMDNETNQITFIKSDEVSVGLEIPLDSIKSGLHFFNFRAINTLGEVGNLTRKMFYMPKEEKLDIAEYEYWLDNDTVNKVIGEDNRNIYELILDVSSLSQGTHSFNFRACNSAGIWGETHVLDFDITFSDIANVVVDDAPFDVYNIAGIQVKRRITKVELNDLPSGIYIIKGKKVFVN